MELNNDTYLNQQSNLINSILDEFDDIKNILERRSLDHKILKYLETYKSYGLEENWLNNPVIIIKTGLVNIRYIGKLIPNVNAIYPLLKNKMPTLLITSNYLASMLEILIKRFLLIFYLKFLQHFLLLLMKAI